MSKKCRTFSTEFKQEAASRVLDQGYSVLQACKSLGVGETALRRWVQQLSEEREGITSIWTGSMELSCYRDGFVRPPSGGLGDVWPV